MWDIIYCISEKAYKDNDSPHYYNFETIDCDYFAAYPGINKQGKFEIFGDASSYLRHMDDEATKHAYRKARQARFEHKNMEEK